MVNGGYLKEIQCQDRRRGRGMDRAICGLVREENCGLYRKVKYVQ